MKRTVTLLAGVAVLGALGYLSSRLWAQAPGSPGAAARVPVALINFPQTLNLYEKFKAYQTDLKAKMDKATTEGDKIKVDIMKYREYMKQPEYLKKPASEQEKYEAHVTKLTRDFEDLNLRIKKDFGDSSASQFVQMFKEVEEQVKLYAKANGYQVVLHYSDHSEKNEALKYAPDALQRRLTIGCMPLYVQDGVDITNTIAAILNQTYRSRAGQPIVPTGGVVPQKK